MARATTVIEAAPEVDQIDGLDLPRERPDLIGQGEAEATLLDAYRSGKIHHGWILGGPKGIGKSTLAFRFARFILANPDPASLTVACARDLTVDPKSATFRRVAVGSHPDLLHLRRPWDEKNKRFKTELPVDEVRQTVKFFGSTAGEGGWRVAIVDPADDLNASAANALLKILEEPPRQALFLVIANQPGRLLPTIRSRCRRLDLRRLNEANILNALNDMGFAGRTDAATLAEAARLADGSLRRAILMIESDGVALHRRIAALVAGLPKVDVKAMHALADEITGKGLDDTFETAIEFLQGHAADAARIAVESGQPMRANAFAEAHAAIGRQIAQSEALNLDRRASVLSVIRTLVEAARN